MNLKEQQKAFARYEITAEEMDLPYEGEYEPYPITLEDLACALQRVKEEGMMADQFTEEWFLPLMMEEGVEIPEREIPEDGLLREEDDVISYILQYLDDAMEEIYYRGDGFQVQPDLSLAFEVMEDYRKNQGKPMQEWDFPIELQEIYIRYIEEKDEKREEISQEEKELFYRYMVDLVAKNNLAALRTRGYLHYGGSSLYPCDWKISRDSLEKVFAINHDARIANTLGYIYYYGRCNNGIPEYEKAFPYFVYGYVHKLYESTYKLADMYRDGKGTIQDSNTYCDMIEELYDYAEHAFSLGNNANMADVALRLADVDENYYYDPEEAYAHYLVAQYALKLREGEYRYGDESVRQKVEEGLARTREEIEHELSGKTTVSTSDFFYNWLHPHCRCTVTIKKLKNEYKLTIRRENPEDGKVLLVFPECDYVSLEEKASVYFEYKHNVSGTYSVDGMDISMATDEWVNPVWLLSDGRRVVSLPPELQFRINRKEK